MKRVCDKLKFDTYKEAELFRKEKGEGKLKPLRIYKCSFCDGYHYTKKRNRSLWGNTGKRSKTSPSPYIPPTKIKTDEGGVLIRTNLINKKTL